MAETPDSQFMCPHCGRRYQWKTKLAGRAVKCKCTGQFRVPAAPDAPEPALDASTTPSGRSADRHTATASSPSSPPAAADSDDAEIEDDDTYALNLPDDGNHQADASRSSSSDHSAQATAATVTDGQCPSCNQAIAPGAVICVKCGFNVREGRKMKVAVTAADAPDAAPVDNAAAPAIAHAVDPRAPTATGAIGSAASAETEQTLVKRQMFIDWILPPILVGLGVVLHFLYEIYFGRDVVNSTIGAAIAVAITVILWVPVLLVLLVVTAKLFDMSFGTLGSAILKLMGIALVPGAVWSFLSHAFMGGWFAGLAVTGIMYWIMFAVLFSIEAIEALNLSGALLVLQLWVIPLLATFIIALVISMLL